MRLSNLKSPKSYKTTVLTMECKSVIHVDNSFAFLDSFSEESILLVKNALTYENEEVIYEIKQSKVQLSMAFRYKNFKKIGWLKSKIEKLEKNITVCVLENDRFPTGLLPIVETLLKDAKVPYVVSDVRKNVAKRVEYAWQKTMPEPRYFQRDMLELGIQNHRGVFESAVGTGKTYVAQLLTHDLKVPTLVILPSKDLSVQTYDSFCEAFGSSKVELVNSISKAKTKKPVKICTIHTLTALLKKETLEAFLEGVGMVLVDEVHHAGANSYSSLLPYFGHIYYRFGFSGTFLRNDSRTLDMWGFLSTVLYRYSASQATKEGFLTPIEVVIHEIEGIRAGSYQTEYTKNYCNNSELLKKILNIIEDAKSSEQMLILVGRKDKSGKVIHEFLTELGIINSYVSGDSERDDVRAALEAFNAKKTRVLIGSTIIGEGIDVRSTDHLIMAQGGKSEIAITQAVGRAVRLYEGKRIAFIHDFKFSNTRYLEKHLEKRLEIYKGSFDAKMP